VEQFSIIMGILSESPDGPAERRLTQSISGSEGGCINEEDGREGVKRKGGFWPSIAILMMMMMMMVEENERILEGL
jgi:hypothetical protein